MHHVHKQPAGCKARHQQDMHAGRAGRPAMAADRGRHRDIFAGSRHVCVRLRARGVVAQLRSPGAGGRAGGTGHARARRRVRPFFARVAGAVPDTIRGPGRDAVRRWSRATPMTREKIGAGGQEQRQEERGGLTEHRQEQQEEERGGRQSGRPTGDDDN